MQATGDELIIVSDSCGFIGAFRSIGEAKEHVITQYSMVPLLVQRFPLAESGGDSVWVVPYRDTNAVAFVSNDRNKSVAAQHALQNVGLTYPDSIDYWEQPIGRIVLAAAERLASCNRAHQLYAAGAATSEDEKQQEAAAAELIKRVVEGTAESPIDRLIRENERITFFDCVIDIIEEGAAEDAEEGAAEDAEEGAAEDAEEGAAEDAEEDAAEDAEEDAAAVAAVAAAPTYELTELVDRAAVCSADDEALKIAADP